MGPHFPCHSTTKDQHSRGSFRWPRRRSYTHSFALFRSSCCCHLIKLYLRPTVFTERLNQGIRSREIVHTRLLLLTTGANGSIPRRLGDVAPWFHRWRLSSSLTFCFFFFLRPCITPRQSDCDALKSKVDQVVPSEWTPRRVCHVQ